MGRAAPAPITAVYSLFADGANAFSAAISFLPHARAQEAFKAPFFVLAEGQALAQPRLGAPLGPLDAIPFGGAEAMAQACGLSGRDADLAERQFHKAYLKFAASGSEAAKPWAMLKEEYRISNRRAVDHIYAKLFEAGFDLRSWLARHDPWRELPALAPGERLFRNDAELDRLALLEHNRWVSDRRLGGWRYGEPRDNGRKLHPDIKPFEALSPKIKAHDRRLVEALNDLLKRKRGGLRRR
jgi:hypothetical protein